MEIKASTIIFWILAAVLLIFGTLYIAWPIAPYHEGIIGMTAEELATNLPEINNLMVALVNVAGIGFLAIGIWFFGHRNIHSLSRAQSVERSWPLVYFVQRFYCVLSPAGLHRLCYRRTPSISGGMGCDTRHRIGSFSYD